MNILTLERVAPPSGKTLYRFDSMQYSLVNNTMRWLGARYKQLLSYFKREWDFIDYPLTTWSNPNAAESSCRFGAGLTNWSTMVGHGSTINEAIADVKASFALYRQTNSSMPRPGTIVPLKFASTARMDELEAVAVDYFEKVLEMDFYEGFYSDGSCLSYFEPSEDEAKAKKFRERIIEKTKAIYHLDISDSYDRPLHELLARIEKSRV